MIEVEPINGRSTIVADSLATQNENYVSARQNLNSSMSTTRTVEEQEIEHYAEQIESFSNEDLVALMHQSPFYHLLENVHRTALGKLLECSLTAASFYRNLMKIIRVILQSEIDPSLIISFTNSIQIPNLPIEYLKAILTHPSIRKEVKQSEFFGSQIIFIVCLALVCSCSVGYSRGHSSMVRIDHGLYSATIR